jgi:hypothetical protein
MPKAAAKPAKSAADFPGAFTKLRALLKKYERTFKVAADQPDNYYLETKAACYQGKPMFFGCVSIRKNYVSFYLMPLYVSAALAKKISPELKQRMQGKSCFNFTAPDEQRFAELAQLAADGLEEYRKRGWV